MGHIINEYINCLGLDKKFYEKGGGDMVLRQSFAPIPFKNYITIDTSNTAQSMQYYYWRDVVVLLRACLPKDYKIVNITNQKQEKLEVDYNFIDLAVNQQNYIIANSKGHITTDHYTAYISTHYSVPTVIMFGNARDDYCGPIDRKSCEILLPKYKNGKPSFSSRENFPVINTIFPDKIINAFGNVFRQPIKIKSPIKINFMGELYHMSLYEVVPDFFSEHQQFNGRLINLRIDLIGEENFELKLSGSSYAAAWVNKYKCSLICKSKINTNFIEKYKKNIACINFVFRGSSDGMPEPEYFQDLKDMGVSFFIYLDSQAYSAKIINKYFDFPITRKQDVDGSRINFDKKMFFSSNKFIFCKDGTFFSHYHRKKLDKNNQIVDDEDFIEDLEHFIIYE